MAKAKTVEGDLQTDYLNMNAISAKGKNTVIVEGINVNDIYNKTAKFQIMNGYLYVIKGDLGVKLSNYKDITTLYLVTNKTESSISYLPINLISNNLIDNMDVISAYKKNSIVGATKYNDTIDATLSGYAPTGKNIKTNKGLTIKGKGGNDTITGTQYNDTIVGGSGQNKVIYNSTTFGTDTIKLTKGELLLLKFEGDLEAGELKYKRSDNMKDLIITNTLADGTTNKVIIKNYCAKDLGRNCRHI